MNILLTGATGFLGSRVLNRLVQEGHSVTIVARHTSNYARIKHLKGFYSTVYPDELDIAFKGAVDAIVHCATVYGRTGCDSHNVLESNLVFPMSILEMAISSGCRVFINTDSFFCKQLPTRLDKKKNLYMPDYTLSKYQFREWGKVYANKGDIVFINLVMEHIYGPNDGKGKFVPWLINQLKDNVPSIELTAGTQMRDFIHVEDAASAFIKVLKDLNQFTGYHSFGVGTAKPITLRSFVEQLKIETGATTELRFGAIKMSPEEILYSAAESTSPYLAIARDHFLSEEEF